MASESEALPDKPDMIIQHARCVCERGEDFALDGNWVLVDFIVERLAEGHDVLAIRYRLGTARGIREPEKYGIEKMKSSAVDHSATTGGVLGAEKIVAPNMRLKSVDDASIMPTIFGQSKKLEDFCGRLEADLAAFLPNRKCGAPNRNETVLPIGDGQLELHLRTCRFWGGQKSPIPSTRCEVSDLRFSRNGA